MQKKQVVDFLLKNPMNIFIRKNTWKTFFFTHNIQNNIFYCYNNKTWW